MQKHQIKCENGTISYFLTRKPVKNVNVRIRPDGRVLVSANNSVPIDLINQFLEKKQGFILSALAKYEQRQKLIQNASRQYISGECFELLGKSVRLEVEESGDETVYADGAFIYLKVRDMGDVRRREILVSKWMREFQRAIFGELISEAYERFRGYGVPFPVLKVRKMKSQWGSCRPTRGIITLNSHLIEAPRSCIEYVVVHEFTHFIHPNHSRQFWDFVAMMMPDWKERKSELERLEGLCNLSGR